VLEFLKQTLVAAVTGLGEDWDRRFLATRGLIARTPALCDRSLLHSVTVQNQTRRGTGNQARRRQSLTAP
jgi:hypothetical protein